ncbi:selenocysteine lyase [Thecamonas trahens ATCC 50062]|uniref:Selenocysteine lyase n=1 Tax=Thecamonas trahens ATCC 50062 TaxID=461836 RepID=A0A0L0D3U5_THETB|nr:selenocysteine lyase [Thecamonas trahens ATCC 50062]KNC47022.1 selenocysteine lyase [Thecamonas trahens ATCC 50062]|eukprot:XP_013759802.1 selenocysteine lyase [Thecamonas trahens ATCC 50062]
MGKAVSKLCSSGNNANSGAICQGQDILEYIHDAVIGCNQIVTTPFGDRVMLYADYTASGRSLQFIEHYMRNEVLPLYGNTHSSNTATSMQTSSFMADARSIILEAVHGSACEDVVLFTGSGSTGAILKVARVLGLEPSHCAWNETKSMELQDSYQAVVFTSLMEHHSNLLPWRESGAHVVLIGLDEFGEPDMDELAEKLELYASRTELLIGSFSAGSNVTGRMTNTKAITEVLREYGALVMFDYAAAAPYVDIDVSDKDAVFISTHKFVGGPGTPGVLVAKKKLFGSKSCADPGGGTVFWVTADDHAYLEAVVYREEGGTPDILGAIRAGLVFQLKAAVTPAAIHAREAKYLAKARKAFRAMDNVHILGASSAEHLTIFSFLISVPWHTHLDSARSALSGAGTSESSVPDAGPDDHPNLYLHHNFVSVLLNDLFGIQTRGGCACAGPLGAYLLQLTRAEIQAFFEAMSLDDDSAIVKPGFSRFGLAYFFNAEDVKYMLDALAFVAEHGYKFLTVYEIVNGSDWVHVGFSNRMRTLRDISYDAGCMSHAPEIHTGKVAPGELAAARASYLKHARKVLAEIEAEPPVIEEEEHPVFQSPYRWFVRPSDASRMLRGEPMQFVPEQTFTPIQFK